MSKLRFSRWELGMVFAGVDFRNRAKANQNSKLSVRLLESLEKIYGDD